MFHTIAAALERLIDSIEMGFTEMRRGLVHDAGHILSDFERITARLDRYAQSNVAANQRDYEKLDALYARIEARRENISRATTASAKISNLTK